MSSPSVSVLLPTYNGARHLHASLSSVLNQDIAAEILICDDFSSDTTVKIIGGFEDPRLDVRRNASNRGLFPTLNSLVERASAPLLKLWSQDDVMLDGCLQRHVDFHRKHDSVAMSYSAFDLIDDGGLVVTPAPADATPEVVSPELASQISFYHGSMPGNIANVAIPRWAFDEVGLFREDLRVAGDFEYWVRLISRFPIGFIRQPLIQLRSHAGQFSRRADVGIDFIRETGPIFKELLERFPGDLRSHADHYDRWHRWILDTHFMVRCFFGGQAKQGALVLQELSRRGPLIPQLARWLVSGNGRFFVPTPRYSTES